MIREHANLSGAEACGCRSQGRASRIEERAQIPPLYRNASFDNFIIPRSGESGGAPRTHNRLARGEDVRPRFSRMRRGRDCCSSAIRARARRISLWPALRKIIEKGFESQFCDYQNLLDRIRSGYDVNSNSANKEAYREALDTDVMLLDDLGAHRVTDWVEDTITSIVTHRCNNRKALIATTNLPG
jgi:DNA replication protein DnaC